MNIQDILLELTERQIIYLKNMQYIPFVGGTSSTIGAISYNGNPKYVLKINQPSVIESEAIFLKFYCRNAFLPKLIYVEPSNRYLVYSYITGSTEYPMKDQSKVLEELVIMLINHYKPVFNPKGWGWADDLTDSWQQFILSETLEANKILGSTLNKEDSEIVLKLVNSHCRYDYLKEPYLLHGDCGVHNFIFNDNSICGVIDPTPVLGDPLYDYIYAFCSSPEELTVETLESTANNLVFNRPKVEKLHEEVLIGLYLRLATCKKHHPKDLEQYLKAWNYWKQIIRDI